MLMNKIVTPEDLRVRAKELTPPFDLLKIATAAGVKVYAADFDSDDGENVSGSVVIENGIPVIYVNRTHPKVRQRFTIAHELGHIVRGHLADGDDELIENEMRFRSEAWNSEEREANAFAAELLMPERWVRDATNAGIIEPKDLATMFGVSEQAMLFRLANLGC